MASYALMAQPKSNSFFAGGSLSISGGKDKIKDGGSSTVNSSYTFFNLNPKVGYFLSDKLAVGVQTEGAIRVTKFPNNTNHTKSTYTGFDFSPYLRYYIINQKFGLFGEASMGFGISTYKDFYQYSSTVKTTGQGFSMGVSPGIYYSISDHIMLESMLGWIGFDSSTQKYDDGSRDVNSSFGLELNSSTISFGFNWVF